MKVSGSRPSVAMQQMMAQRANKQNNGANNARKSGGGSDNDGAESSRSQKSDQTGGGNYNQLIAALNNGAVRPTNAVRNRAQNRDNADGNATDRNMSPRQPAQAAKTGSYNETARMDKQQSTYGKGEIVNLTA
ncbi:MAG: hypothetical protein HZA04_01990 [Nitrospinae bacterium]|nr:hypothetical protein [Nitrospinota bacterium]